MSTVNGAWRGPNIVKTGLVHYIDPSSPNSYNPLTFGSRAIDIMKTGLDGSYTNVAYNTIGAGSIFLTGASSNVDYGSNAIFAFGTSNFAIDAWIYKTSTVTSAGGWSTYRTGAANVGVKFGFGTNLDFRVGNDYGGTLNSVSDPATLSLSTWFHVVATRLNGTLFLYKNGVSVGTPAADSQNITQSQMILGPWYPDLINAFLYAGYIASIRTYKGYGFTQADAAQNFNAQRSRFGI